MGSPSTRAPNLRIGLFRGAAASALAILRQVRKLPLQLQQRLPHRQLRRLRRDIEPRMWHKESHGDSGQRIGTVGIQFLMTSSLVEYKRACILLGRWQHFHQAR